MRLLLRWMMRLGCVVRLSRSRWSLLRWLLRRSRLRLWLLLLRLVVDMHTMNSEAETTGLVEKEYDSDDVRDQDAFYAGVLANDKEDKNKLESQPNGRCVSHGLDSDRVGRKSACLWLLRWLCLRFVRLLLIWLLYMLLLRVAMCQDGRVGWYQYRRQVILSTANDR